jgi:hypothetical protein
MNGNRHVQLPARIPHRIESRIVDLHQIPRSNLIPQVKPECLENLQPMRPVAARLLDCLGLYPRIIGLQQPRVTWLGESVKTIAITPVVLLNGLSQARPESSREIHHGANILAIHHCDQLAGRGVEIPFRTQVDSVDRLARLGNVRVDVDHRVARSLNSRLSRVQHAGGPIVGKIESGWLRPFIVPRGRLHPRTRGNACHQSHAGSVQKLAAVHFLCPPLALCRPH